MNKTRRIIVNNKVEFKYFTYYLDILDKIDQNVNDMPDIAIESCKALVEGISKTILKNLGEKYFEIEKTSETPNKLLKMALEELSKHSNIDNGFIQSAGGFIHRVSEVRNERGDISHGKSVPKIINSDQALAEMVAHTTDGIIYYILNIFFNIKLPNFNEIQYEDNVEFNDFLDGENDLIGVVYSKALFDQDIVAYKEQFNNYLSDKDEK